MKNDATLGEGKIKSNYLKQTFACRLFTHVRIVCYVIKVNFVLRFIMYMRRNNINTFINGFVNNKNHSNVKQSVFL